MFGGAFGIWQWLIILAIVLLLFGGRGKISSLMGDVGKGLRNFKSGVAGGDDDDDGGDAAAEAPIPVRKRGRPRKDEAQKRKPGRPRKDEATPKRKPGRPRKDETIAKRKPGRPRKVGRPRKRGRPRKTSS